jgi:hypothetical protein
MALPHRGSEPFRSIGLEAVTAGGIAVCDATGEEYAESSINAIVCDTSDEHRLAAYLRTLFANPNMAADLERKLGYVDAALV